MPGYDWFEVWTDDTAHPPYLLLLMAKADDAGFEIFDPVEKCVRKTLPTYPDAMLWLTEDEYTKVDGRIIF